MAIIKTHITTSDPTPAQIADWMAYASISDDTQTTLYLHCLKAALVAVGDWENVSLLAGTVRVNATQREDNTPVALYGTVDAVTSVTSGGTDLAYTAADGFVSPVSFTESVSVTYTTKVNEGDLLRHIVKAWRYATALYDGEDSTALASILTSR